MPPPTTPGDNGQNGADNGDENQPTFVTEDRVAAIVNAAVTSHLKRTLDKSVGDAITKALDPIRQKLETPAPAPQPDDKSPDKSKPNPEVAALQKQVSDMQAALKLKDEEAATQRRQAREDKAFTDLVGALTGKVKPGSERTAALVLRAEGRLVVDDDGNASLKVRTSLAKGQPEQDHEFPIADGVGHFLKTKEADLFIPPPNQGGAGGTRRSTGVNTPGSRPNGQPQDAVQAFEAQHGPIDDHLL